MDSGRGFMGEAGPSTHENVLYFLFSFAEPKTASKILKKKKEKKKANWFKASLRSS